MKSVTWLACVLCMATGAACGDDDGGGGDGGGPDGGTPDAGQNLAAPMLIAGGGIGSGAINGKVNVYAIDSRTKTPLAGVAVRIGAASANMPLTGTTDTTGLCSFTEAMLIGAQTITVSHGGHAAGTWIGVNGANVTIPMDPAMDPTPQTATAAGTITGWDTDPRLAPAAGHYTIALVTYSHTDDFDDPANELAQPTDGMGNDLNVCGRFPGGPATCNWQMNVRTGGQVHYAIIMDGDANGTPMNFDDDVWTFKAYALKTGINLSSGQASTGEALTLLADADVQTLTVTFPAVTPTGLGNVMAMPILDAGAEGWLFLPLPALSPTSTTSRVPRLTGALASGSYKLLARAQTTTPMTEVPNTGVFMHDVNISGTVQITDWLPTATSLSAMGGTYSFGAVSGANLHAVDFRDATGKKAWAVALLDGSTSFTLPALTPDGLPAGTVDMEVNAIDVTGFSASDFMLDNLFDTLNRMSANTLRFTH